MFAAADMVKRYEAILNQPVHQQPEPHALIAVLAEAESGLISERNSTCGFPSSVIMQRRNRLTALREEQSLKEALAWLTDGTFIAKAENLLITGATRCGKNYTGTLYYSMNRFIEALAAARLAGTYPRWINVIAKTPLR